MKKLFFFIMTFCLLNAAAAQPLLDCAGNLPFFPDSGWTYVEGLDVKGIENGYANERMKEINPTLPVFNIKDINPSKPYTLQLRFRNLSSCIESRYLCVEQSGASRIYLDGKLIQEYGLFDTTYRNIKAYNPLNQPILLKLRDTGMHTLTVHYLFQPGLNLRPNFNVFNPLFKVGILNMDEATKLYANRRIVALDFFKIGFTLMLFLVHFIAFLFYPPARVQLLFSLYALIGSIGFYILFRHHDTFNVEEKNILNFAFGICSWSSTILLLIVFMQLMKPIRPIWIAIFLLTLTAWVLNSFYGIDPYRVIFDFAFGLTGPIIFAWLSYKGISKGKPASSILFWASILYFVFWILFLGSNLVNTSLLFRDILLHLAIFTFPLSISMVLSQKFRFINMDLEKRMREVKFLSQEKQDLLSRQNEILEKQVGERTAALSKSLSDLKSTQQQLLQSEKMASLGELTAGIAHEIQNPLNFVNNFSELNSELSGEIVDAVAKGDFIIVNQLALDIKSNGEKIQEHGKRADAIVKNMLQHSKSSSMGKEPTDINALADEYLRLALSGFKTKDKNFNVILITDFDESIGQVNVIPQDISRVLVNLYNNAFYALATEVKAKGEIKYDPYIRISSKNLGESIQIEVSDNGIGIPAHLKDKIFQPFFTTKPTGQGTGLGLSLAYDIVTKGHGGELSVVQTDSGETTFKIILPYKKTGNDADL